MRKLLTLLILAGTAGSALASYGSGYSLFGTTAYVTPGSSSDRAVRLEADDGTEFGGVDYGIPKGTTVSDLSTLSTEYFFPLGSTCGGGSPRFQINVDHDGKQSTPSRNIHVYIGPPPDYTACPTGVWSDSGNLIDAADTVDATQLGGVFYQPWATVVANYGALNVTGIQLVTDTFAGPRTVVVDNTNVDETIYTYERDKQDCKNGGWMEFPTPPGPFTNQGDCVSYFATQQS